MNDRLDMKMSPPEYIQLMALVKQRASHPYVLKFRKPGTIATRDTHVPRILDDYGRSFTLASRKSARAQVHMIKGDGQVFVNGLHISQYFSDAATRQVVVSPLTDYSSVSLLSKYVFWFLIEGIISGRWLRTGVETGLHRVKRCDALLRGDLRFMIGLLAHSYIKRA
jgi:hypothetical protein